VLFLLNATTKAVDFAVVTVADRTASTIREKLQAARWQRLYQ
jgi:hypothetical protein